MPKFNIDYFANAILADLNDELVAANVVNDRYVEDDFSAGDTVKVYGKSEVTVRDYDGTAIDADSPNDPVNTMNIDQHKYFAVDIDDLDQMFNNLDVLETYASDARRELEAEADRSILQYMKDQATSNNTDLVGVTSDLEAKFASQIRKEREKIVDAGGNEDQMGLVVGGTGIRLIEDNLAQDLQDTDTAQAGFRGRFAGLPVFRSANVPVDSSAGTEFATVVDIRSTTFANDLDEVEQMRLESKFASRVRGLHVYGLKTWYPQLIRTIEITRD